MKAYLKIDRSQRLYASPSALAPDSPLQTPGLLYNDNNLGIESQPQEITGHSIVKNLFGSENPRVCSIFCSVLMHNTCCAAGSQISCTWFVVLDPHLDHCSLSRQHLAFSSWLPSSERTGLAGSKVGSRTACPPSISNPAEKRILIAQKFVFSNSKT